MSVASNATRIGGLDALRAISVTLVFAYHAPFTSGTRLLEGHSGVLLFFVISGYLITSLSLRELDAGRFRLAGFYIRRATRILPLYVAMFCVYGLAVALMGTPIERSLFVNNWPLLALPNSDIAVALHGTSVPFSISWSIGVEEKFYVLWPIAIIFSRSSRRFIAITAAFIILASAAASGLLFTSGSVDAARFAVSPYCAISAGILLACIRLPKKLKSPRLLFGLLLAAFLATAPLVAGGASGIAGDLLVSTIAVMIVAVVVVSASSAPGTSGEKFIRLLESRPLVYIGTRSYAIYLVQRIGIVAATAVASRLGLSSSGPEAIVTFALSLVTTLFLAEFAHRVIERPVRGWGRRVAERFA